MGGNASTPKNGTSKVVKLNGLGLPAISVNFEMLLEHFKSLWLPQALSI
jgi:hypothetical protein